MSFSDSMVAVCLCAPPVAIQIACTPLSFAGIPGNFRACSHYPAATSKQVNLQIGIRTSLQFQNNLNIHTNVFNHHIK